MAGPRDPFAPPDEPTGAPLELEETPSRAWPLREDETPPPLKVAEPRKPVKYKNASSSANLIIFSFALIGFIGVVGFAVGALRRSVEGVKAEAASAAAPAPRKPVTWKALDKDDAVLVTVEVSPRSAKLLLDGEPMPSNPARIPRGSGKHTIAAMADGYQAVAEEIEADAAKTVKLKLARAK